MLPQVFEDAILKRTCSKRLAVREVIQTLWSGYGEILRVDVEQPHVRSVVVKYISPGRGAHPRGWDTDLSHQRKLKSYQVEAHWYAGLWGGPVDGGADYPDCHGVEFHDDEILIILDDMDMGFPGRRSLVNPTEWQACVRWLATFHAAQMGQPTQGLWETGTYWHLATRPDELEELDDLPLKNAASAIDQKLKVSPFQTLVHGDAKLANFCFSPDGSEVAAVDFQYIGGGCGMKDLAYFVGSCFRDNEAEQKEEEILDYYFEMFASEMELQGYVWDTNEIIADWRPLYRVAWADFHRFMKGWSPGHWKLSDYSERVTREVIADLQEEAV